MNKQLRGLFCNLAHELLPSFGNVWIYLPHRHSWS